MRMTKKGRRRLMIGGAVAASAGVAVGGARLARRFVDYGAPYPHLSGRAATVGRRLAIRLRNRLIGAQQNLRVHVMNATTPRAIRGHAPNGAMARQFLGRWQHGNQVRASRARLVAKLDRPLRWLLGSP